MSHLRLDTIDHLSDMTMTINASDTATYHDIFEQAKTMNAKTLNGGNKEAVMSATSTFDSALLDQSWAFSSTSESDIHNVGGGDAVSATADNYSFSASSTLDQFFAQQGGFDDEDDEDDDDEEQQFGGEGEGDEEEEDMKEKEEEEGLKSPEVTEEKKEEEEEEEEEQEGTAVVGGARRGNKNVNRFTTGSRKLTWMKNGSFGKNKNKFLFSDIDEEEEEEDDDSYEKSLSSLGLSTSDLSMFKPY
jgi:hypothetical protein